MAAAAGLDVNDFMRDTLEIDNANDPSDIRDAIIEQGIDDWDTMHKISEAQLEAAFKAVISPGGTIIDAAGNEVRNRGQNLTVQTQIKVKKMVYYLRYTERVQRDWVPGSEPDMAELDEVWGQKLVAGGHNNDIEMPEKLTNIKHIRQVVEGIEAYLDQKLGQDKIPLAYVIRTKAALPGVGDAIEEDDPGLGLPDFATEMIRRTRHNGPYWEANKAAVWRVMRHVFYGTEVFTYIKKFQVRRNGRQAFITVKEMYL